MKKITVTVTVLSDGPDTPGEIGESILRILRDADVDIFSLTAKAPRKPMVAVKIGGN